MLWWELRRPHSISHFKIRLLIWQKWNKKWISYWIGSKEQNKLERIILHPFKTNYLLPIENSTLLSTIFSKNIVEIDLSTAKYHLANNSKPSLICLRGGIKNWKTTAIDHFGREIITIMYLWNQLDHLWLFGSIDSNCILYHILKRACLMVSMCLVNNECNVRIYYWLSVSLV